MNRTDFQVLSDARLDEAKALLAAGLYGGAYYLAGYAVECALKACIAKRTQPCEFPDKVRALRAWTHDFEQLAEAAGISADLIARRQTDRHFDDAWEVVAIWSEASRYNPAVAPDAVIALIGAIANQPDGVLAWIHERW